MTKQSASGGKVFKALSPKGFPELVDFACQMRKYGKDACFIHIRGVTERSKVNLPEIMATMQAGLHKSNAMVLENTPKNEVLIVVHENEDWCKSVVNGNLYTKVSPHAVIGTVYPLQDRGIEHLIKVFESSIETNDFKARLGLIRFARKANVIMVLDDDPMILKQMDFMLKSVGQVVCTEMAEEFLHRYKQLAPNCVFIDVHLKTEKGTDLAGVMRQMIDPHAYVIIISSDTVKENIIETRTKGGSGFIGKPINRDIVMRAIASCPTFMPKK